MSILWDAPLTAAVARELHDHLVGSRLRAVRMDRDRRNLVLHFRNGTLVFRLHPLHGDVALLDAREPGPEAVTLKARCRQIHAPPDERLLMLQFQPPGGGAPPEGIVVELLTNQWNAVWLTVGNDRIRRVLWKRTLKARKLAAGEVYRPPSPSDRRGIDEPLSEEEWMELFVDAGPQDGSRDPAPNATSGNETKKGVKKKGIRAQRGTLLRSVAFTSSLNASSLLGASGAELRKGYHLWRRIRAVALGLEDAEPCLLKTEKRNVPYPLPLPEIESPRRPSLLEAFGDAVDRGSGASTTAAALIPGSLMERLDEAVKRADAKADRLREELAETPDPDPIRGVGDLILARFSRIPEGSESVTLEGFEGEPVDVELDPSLSTAENAERYYGEAARIERALSRLPELIEEALKGARELRKLKEKAELGEVSAEDLEEALPPEPSRRRGQRRDQTPSLPYRRYRSAGGLEIRVGRGARANDDLTFHHSSPDDIWLHARQGTGAHVILRWQDEGNPPARDLAQAASLAALHSEARHASSVPVDWTRRKYVRSPRKSPPGVVVPDRVQTVFVDPDPELARRLQDG